MRPNQNKTDKNLGRQVHEHLVDLGIETPAFFDVNEDRDEKKRYISEQFANIMTSLGLNLEDDSLQDTPNRIAKMYIDEIMYGLDYDWFPKCTAVENKMHYDQMVIERNIEVRSLCEHHFVTIHGVCHIGYIPNKSVLGLSKMNRVVDFFSRRPQIQERLTAQIAETLKFILKSDDVIVVVSGIHHCVRSRGVEDSCSDTVTSQVSGVFKESQNARDEFLKLIDLPASI